MTRRWERRLAVLCAVSGVLLLAVAGTLWLLDQEMNRQLAYSLIACVALLIGYAVLDASALTDLARTRRGRSGSISVLTTAVVLGLLVGINILASRGSQAADLSKAHLNTLAPQSVLVTKRLDADLNVIGFYRPTGADAQSRQDAQELLTLYANESRRVKVTFANPDLSPEELQRYGVRTSGTLVLAFKGKTELLAPGSQGEQDVTSAILKLESERTPQLCWVGGDGERDLKEANQITGYSAAADILNRNNFKTRDLLLTAAVPADCDAVAVVGAQKPLTSDAQKFLAGYLAGGGKLLVAADPWLDGGTLDSLNQVAKPYGVSFDGGLVIDPDPAHNANDPRVPAAVRYGDSPITRGLASRISVLEDTTAVSADSSAGAMVTPIVTTSNQAYEVPSKRSNLTKQSGDKAGPFVLMETAEKEQSGKKTRIVLVGTSLFGANLAMPPQFPGVNTQLLVGSMEWLSEQDNLIALPPRASRVVPLALTAEQQGLVFLLTLLVMPALVACGGIWVWARRRYS
jgi:ABC-type uncharacterized transport system involved in gliding motility auxiliary subunit